MVISVVAALVYSSTQNMHYRRNILLLPTLDCLHCCCGAVHTQKLITLLKRASIRAEAVQEQHRGSGGKMRSVKYTCSAGWCVGEEVM